jgi:RNA polymerase sigma factor (sigma-70 family)
MRTHKNEQHEGNWRRVRFSERAVEDVGEQQGLWYESPEEVEAQLVQGGVRDARMRWVLRQMERRLEARERRCVEMHYLQDKTFREIAKELALPKSAVERIVRGAVAKLRSARRRR